MDIRDRADEIRERLDDITGPHPTAAELALVVRLIRSFAGKTAVGAGRLGELLRGGDAAAVRDQAHAMRGSASNIGAGRLAAIFADVEHAARDGRVPEPDVTLGRITAEQALVLGILDEVAAELDP